MIFLIIGYIWLYTHRPFEVWTFLADFQIERLYMIAMICVWLLTPHKRLPANSLHLAFGLFATTLVAAYLVSDYPEPGWKVVENYLKIAAFYLILVTSVRSQEDLLKIVVGFLVSTAIYQLHSLWEYRNGRHVYRMGTARMIGVDAYLGDPNSFAASVNYALPYAFCLFPLARQRLPRAALSIYSLLGVVCVLLTGSRTGLFGLGAQLILVLLFFRNRIRNFLIFTMLLAVLFTVLPDDRKERFWTIIDPSRGPANAEASANSRSQYFTIALSLWGEQPLLGYGPGSFAIVSGTGQPAHTLYGEVLAELGTMGAIAMICILLGFAVNHLAIATTYAGTPWMQRDALFWISLAIQVGILLHLLLGFGGHNTYRHTWLWFGAFQILATEFATNRNTESKSKY